MNALVRTISRRGCRTILALGISLAATAQNKAAIEKKLTSEYALTQATADQADIVTAGAILVLKKGTIVMGPASQTNLYQSTYKDGKINANFAGKFNSGLTKLSRLPGAAPPASTTRTFVPGEKMWLTKIDCKDDGVVFELFTDAYAEIRYKAALKFVFDKKGAMPSADQMSQMVAEVFKVQPADDATGGAQQQAAPQQGAVRSQAPPAVAAPPAAALPPIPPPPPPADEPAAPPKTLSLGQTKDQVVATMGPPDKIVKLGAKEIYVYKDFKVTLVNGKVTDFQ